MLQQTPSTSNQREGLSIHEINMEKGVDEFSKIMDQFGVEHHWMKESAEFLEQQSEKAVKMQKDINEIYCNFPAAQEQQE